VPISRPLFARYLRWGIMQPAASPNVMRERHTYTIMYILIVNEDPLGRSLAQALVANGHEVAYLDEDPEYCDMVAQELGCLVIQGETTNIRVLREGGIARADVLVALLEKDIENIMVGLFARQYHVPHILALLRQEHYRPAYELAGITNIFSAFDYLLNELLTAIEDPNVRQIMALGDGRVEIAAVDVPDQSPFIGTELQAVWQHRNFPHGVLVLGLLKADEQRFHLPRDGPIVEVDDELLIVASRDDIHRVAHILDKRRAGILH
jgi:trk system potassium uptake protein TrkA